MEENNRKINNDDNRIIEEDDYYEFNNLLPITLSNIDNVYKDSLDHALNDKSIKNIAITGIYGSGKSTVWESYKNISNLNNVITVTLGDYEIFNKFEGSKRTGENKKNKDLSDEENSIERQLINQISAQVKQDKIPKSKYKYKENKSKMVIFSEAFGYSMFVISIIAFSIRDKLVSIFKESIKETTIYLIGFIIFTLSIIFIVYKIIQSNKTITTKIKISDTETSLQDYNNTDETVMDRDIRELVYIIHSSDAEYIVFEDLDRYNNIEIYKKLLDLNFLINSYELTMDNSPVRFIYLLRDGIFDSKDRTKLFDFILPIVPIVSSQNSENELIKMFRNKNYSPKEKTIFNMSLYIDDMRLLRNIVNEYIVYYNIISLNDLELDKDKLFSIIVFKNIFPYEFDLLQQDKGYVFKIIHNIDIYRDHLKKKLSKSMDEIVGKIEFLEANIENSKFKLMANFIPSGIRISDRQDVQNSWPEVLESWHYNPDDEKYISSSTGTRYYNYTEFVDMYIIKKGYNNNISNNFFLNKEEELRTLYKQKREISFKINKIDLLKLSELFRLLNYEEKDKIFNDEESYIQSSHYFPLIKFILMEGLIDETYKYYISYFYKEALGVNDTVYIKNLIQGEENDIYLRLETPNKVIDRLSDQDLKRFNFLNYDIFKEYLDKNDDDSILIIVESIVYNDNLNDLVELLHKYLKDKKHDHIKKFIDIYIITDISVLKSILIISEEEYLELFYKIMKIIYGDYQLNEDAKLINGMMESHVDVLGDIPKPLQKQAIKNCLKLGIKFDELYNYSLNKSLVKDIMQNNIYELTLENVIFIIDSIKDGSIDKSKLLDYIYYDNSYKELLERIKENYNTFLIEYIEKFSSLGFKNNQSIVIDILNSNLEINYKKAYLKYNSSVIEDLTKINNLEILVKERLTDYMFEKLTLRICDNNIQAYLDAGGDITGEFIRYLQRNLNNKSINNFDNIISTKLANELIRYINVEKDLYELAVSKADTKISRIDENFDESRLFNLIDNSLIEPNINNISIMINFHQESLVYLFNKAEISIPDIILSNSKLTEDLSSKKDLIYTLSNQVRNQSEIVKLLELFDKSLSISKVDFEKTEIICYIISKFPTEENINYVIENFDKYESKNVIYRNIIDKINFNSTDFESASTEFLNHILNDEMITNKKKMVIIINDIYSRKQNDRFIELLKKLDTTKKLSTVFEGKYPRIDTDEEKEVAKALEECDYIKIRSDNRIMPLKFKKK